MLYCSADTSRRNSAENENNRANWRKLVCVSFPHLQPRSIKVTKYYAANKIISVIIIFRRKLVCANTS